MLTLAIEMVLRDSGFPGVVAAKVERRTETRELARCDWRGRSDPLPCSSSDGSGR
jgi:hypothetical protein